MSAGALGGAAAAIAWMERYRLARTGYQAITNRPALPIMAISVVHKVVSPREVCGDLSLNEADGCYVHCLVVFESGGAAGSVFDVAEYHGADRRFVLNRESRNPIREGDMFQILAPWRSPDG